MDWKPTAGSHSWHEIDLHRMIENAGMIDPVIWLPMTLLVFKRSLPIYDFTTQKLVRGMIRQAVYIRTGHAPMVIQAGGQQLKVYQFILESVHDVKVAP